MEVSGGVVEAKFGFDDFGYDVQYPFELQEVLINSHA